MKTQFLERTWYFGGWSDALAVGAAKEIILAGKRLALYRTGSRTVAAIGNRCPHRFAQLHLGKVKGSNLECPYHGLQFGADGKCALSPHNNGAVPPIGVPSYAVVERDGAIWIWLSALAEADPALIPDMSELTTYPATCVVDVPTMQVKGNYQLLADNLMDPTHADILHLGKLGNGLLSTQRGSVKVENGAVTADWTWKGRGPMPFMNQFVSDPENIETWFQVRWNAPGVIRLESGVTPLGRPRSEGVWVVVFHLFMPSSEQMTTYDVRSVRNNATDDVELTARTRELSFQLFNEEDRPMIEAQQAMMENGEFWELAPALLPSDRASVSVRRQLAALIAAEQAASA